MKGRVANLRDEVEDERVAALSAQLSRLQSAAAAETSAERATGAPPLHVPRRRNGGGVAAAVAGRSAVDCTTPKAEVIAQLGKHARDEQARLAAAIDAYIDCVNASLHYFANKESQS